MVNEEKMKLRRLKTRRWYNENRQVAKEKNLTKTKDLYFRIHKHTHKHNQKNKKQNDI